MLDAPGSLFDWKTAGSIDENAVLPVSVADFDFAVLVQLRNWRFKVQFQIQFRGY